MATRVGSLAVLLFLEGCCLTVVSGGTGNHETGAGTTGARAATSTGGVVQYCGPAANLSNTSSYTSLPLDLVVSADLNGDGLVFAPPAVVPGIGVSVIFSQFLVSDLNQDGLPDIVANATDGSQLAVLLNQGDGGFQTTLYPTPAYYQLVSLPRAGTAPDLAFELMSPAYDMAGLQVLKNSGRGSFSIGQVYPLLNGYWLSVGDFNGDCIPDIVTDQGSSCPTGTSHVFVLYGDGDGGFEAPVSLPTIANDAYGIASLGSVGNPRAFAVADACGGGVTVYGDASKP